MMQNGANSSGQPGMNGIPLLQRQGHHQTGQVGGSTEQSGLLYDLSSFDPLQAHALQLTASAGLNNLLAPSSAPGAAAPGVHQHGTTGENSMQMQSMQPQHLQVNQLQIQHGPGTQGTQTIPQLQQQHQANPYFFLQQSQGSANSALQPIAPATQQAGSSSITQASGLGRTATSQSFLLPATSIPPSFPSQLLQNNLAGSPGAVLPNFLMTQHFKNVVASAAQQQQQQLQQQPPLQTQLVQTMLPKKRENESTSVSEQPLPKKQELSPSVISSSTSSEAKRKGGNMMSCNDFMGNCDLDSPPEPDPDVDLESMTPAERRRYERNMREQQRSYRISQQIKELRDVLSDSNVPFKPNKYSILLSVVDYIKQLQARAIMLDAEHQKLITTIRQTNELVNSGNTPSSADETEATNTTSASDSGSDSEMLFVQGLDYRSVFEQCPAALAIAALDGRILECNPEFEILLGLPRDDLLKQSLFNLVRNHQEIFRAMAEMLKTAEDPPDCPGGNAKGRFWSGQVISKRDSQLLINLTLTMGDDGCPKFFNCALSTAT